MNRTTFSSTSFAALALVVVACGGGEIDGVLSGGAGATGGAAGQSAGGSASGKSGAAGTGATAGASGKSGAGGATGGSSAGTAGKAGTAGAGGSAGKAGAGAGGATGGSSTAGSTSTGGSATAGSTSTGGSATAGSTSTGGSATAGSTSTGGSATAGSTSTGGSATAGSTSTGGSATAGSAGAGPCVPGDTQCTNCIDDDGDGLTDDQDPECTGPADNDEKTFATGIPGDNVDCKQDCFFDGNSGQGANECTFNTKCDPQSTDPKCGFNPNTQNCTNFPNCDPSLCVAFTPNGCDCYGCCTVPNGMGGTVNVKLVDTCSLDKVNDATACPVCTPQPDCANPCDTCEICVGKPTLPPECLGSGGAAGASGAAGAAGDAGTGGTAGSGGTPQQCPASNDPPTGTPCDAANPCPVHPTKGAGFCLTGCCVYGKP